MSNSYEETIKKERRNFFGKIALIAVGVAGLVYGLSLIPPRTPNKEFYNKSIGVGINRNNLIDFDGDGKVDIISPKDDVNFAIYVAPDIAEKVKFIYSIDVMKETPRMTPEIRDLATKVLQAQRELGYAIDEDVFKRYQKENKK